MSGQHRAHFRSHPVDLQHCWQDLLQRAFHHRSVEATTFSHALHYMCNLTSFADAMKLGFLCFVVLLQLLAQERTGTTLCDSYTSTPFSTLIPTPCLRATSQLWEMPPVRTDMVTHATPVISKEVSKVCVSIFKRTGNCLIVL